MRKLAALYPVFLYLIISYYRSITDLRYILVYPYYRLPYISYDLKLIYSGVGWQGHVAGGTAWGWCLYLALAGASTGVHLHCWSPG